ncbi:MAG: DUF4417 domain-containing protein [Clostridiales bacterium]|nr:DUF4417 domain-containing protein [Clostridiales bacterium]
MNSKNKYDDGFQAYLTEDAVLVGEPGIPMLMDLGNTEVPEDIIPFTKARTCKNKRQYVHFYEHDKQFSQVLTGTRRYLDMLKQFDGVITPDCTMLIGQAKCLQEANTYMNRAVGYFFQRNGIPVIPNIRWSDESSFEFCFLGVPKGGIVAISTHGCIRTKEQRRLFRAGLKAMIDELKPTDVIVHGYMPEEVFSEFKDLTRFHRYKSQFEKTHPKDGE